MDNLLEPVLKLTIKIKGALSSEYNTPPPSSPSRRIGHRPDNAFGLINGTKYQFDPNYGGNLNNRGDFVPG